MERAAREIVFRCWLWAGARRRGRGDVRMDAETLLQLLSLLAVGWGAEARARGCDDGCGGGAATVFAAGCGRDAGAPARGVEWRMGRYSSTR